MLFNFLCVLQYKPAQRINMRFATSVFESAHNSLRTAGQILVKFEGGEFYWMSTNSGFLKLDRSNGYFVRSCSFGHLLHDSPDIYIKERYV